VTKKTSPKAPAAKKNSFQMFLNEYKLGKTGPYLEDGRKVWSAKSIAFKAKYKQAAFDANASK
jgi:hypothetical protein